MKNKIITLLAAFSTILLFSVCALADTSTNDKHGLFVDKNKVWRYSIVNYFGGAAKSEEEGPSMKFQKDDIRIGDYDYSVLVQINKDGEVTDTIALLRQDGNRLYIFNDKRFNQTLIADNKKDNPDFLDKEILVYDFDAQIGDIYTGIACGDVQPNEVIRIFVDSVETIEINGLLLKKQHLRNAENPDFSDYVFAVNGFGVLGPKSFILPYLGCKFGGSYLSPHSELKLKEVTDAEGKVIFTEKDFSLREYSPMLVDGRVLEFVEEVNDYYQDVIPNRYKLNGTVERFGKTYHKLISEKSNHTVALLREENGKVWRLAGADGKVYLDNDNGLDRPEGLPDATVSTEFLLYDMSLGKGETIRLVSAFPRDMS